MSVLLELDAYGKLDQNEFFWCSSLKILIDRCLVNDKIINGYSINILNPKLIPGFFRPRKEY